MSDACNAAFDVIQAGYVTFVNSDDYIALEKVDTLVQNIIEHKYNIVCCGVNVLSMEVLWNCQYRVSTKLLCKRYDAKKLLFEDEFPKYLYGMKYTN